MRTLFYSLRVAGLLAVLGGAVSGCLNPPDYSTTPSIDNARLDVQRITKGSLGLRDSMIITVSYQDGDGDLGLNSSGADMEGVYAYENGNNINYYNYLLQAQVRDPVDKIFKDFTTPLIKPGQDYGRFPRITADGSKEAPVKGDLTYGQSFLLDLGTTFLPGQEVRFVISIQDRALHRSNTVTTPSRIIEKF